MLQQILRVAFKRWNSEAGQKHVMSLNLHWYDQNDYMNSGCNEYVYCESFHPSRHFELLWGVSRELKDELFQHVDPRLLAST